MRQLPLQLAAMMLVLVFLVSCDRKPQTPLPPAWSFDVWTYVTLPKPPDGSTHCLVKLFEMKRTLPFPSDFNWETDKKLLVDRLPEIHALMDAAPSFTTVRGLAIDENGSSTIDGRALGIDYWSLNDIAQFIVTILEQHEDLADLKARDRAQGFALFLIRFGSELQALPVHIKQAQIVHLTAASIIDKGYRILHMLDQADSGHRLSKPHAEIDALLMAASKSEAKRRSMLRELGGSK